MLQRKIFVAIGANLYGPGGRSPLGTCEWAVERLGRLPGIVLEGRSRWYRTAPVPPSGQADYINGVVALRGAVGAAAMLAALHEIEAEAGRERGVPNAARTLDLDLLAMDDEVIEGVEGLWLPHPRMQERSFVLAPLLDVAPGWVHPVSGVAGAVLLAGLDRTGIALLPLGGTEILAGAGVSA